MMQIEFGEKLKACREEKGMTQQTLADKLYVTRQAVSRWECGARYPDLITAKRIAEELEVSLDELVSGEKYIRDIEKEPVITAPASLMVQTVLYVMACVPYLIMCFYNIGVRVPYGIVTYEEMGISSTTFFVVIIMESFINFMVMAIGVYYSVKNDLSSHRIGWVMSIRFFVHIIVMTIVMLIVFLPMIRNGNGTLAWSSRLRFLFNCIAPFMILGFFNAKKPVNVKYIYVAACILAVFLIYDTWEFAYLVRYDINVMKDIRISSEINGADHITRLIDMIGNLAYTLLLAFQAYTLNKKRAAANL